MSGQKNGRRTSPAEQPEGPGRPRRTIEREYLAALGETVTLDDWRAIVLAAVGSAKAGDAKARDWLARYLLGEKSMSLADLAADEAGGFEAGRDVQDRMLERRKCRELADLLGALGRG